MSVEDRQAHADLALPTIMSSTWATLEASTRRKIVASGIVSALLGTLDAIGVGLVPEMVTRLKDPTSTSGLLGGLSTPILALVAGTCLIVKSLGGAAVLVWQSSFIAHDEGQRTIALFRRILTMPYARASQRNTAGFIRDLHVSMLQLYRGSALGMALLIADGLGVLALVVLVIFDSWLTGLTLFVFILVVSRTYSSLIRSRANELGIRLQQENEDCLNEMTESFGGLKTLKAFSSEPLAVRRFSQARERFASSTREVLIYTSISRYYLEVVLVVGIGLCLGVTWLIEGRGAILASFGLLAGVAARALPALGRVLTSLTLIKVSGDAVRTIKPELEELEEEVVEDPAAHAPTGPASVTTHTAEAGGADELAPLLSLDRVSFRYPTGHEDALRDISLDLRAGELVVVQGESGAGKTTLADVLIGLLEPTSGAVRSRDATFGYVAQETFIWDDSVRFNVALERPARSGDTDAEVWAALDAARLGDWVRHLPDGLDARLGERGGRMSGGQRQRLGLARALYGHPTVLLLDEPTSALDAETSRSLMATLVTVKRGIATVVVTHDPIVVEFADRTVNLASPHQQRRAV